MQIVRYRDPHEGRTAVGLRVADQLLAVAEPATMSELLALGTESLRRVIEAARAEGRPAPPGSSLLAPVDGSTEVWACGVTYEISRAARVEESEHSADVYVRVYSADRPELFFKSTAWRVVGDGGTIAVRADSTMDVPEPELAVVVDPTGDIIGYTICDDVSSRSIEGENPLYLPQAKIYLGGCALGPGIVPAWEVPNPYALAIELRIERDGETAWSGETNTALLHRRVDELVSYLMRADIFPGGAVLSTGTCLVPPAPFSLQHGDVVSISIEGLGTLTTPVVRGLDALLAAAQLERANPGGGATGAQTTGG